MEMKLLGKKACSNLYCLINQQAGNWSQVSGKPTNHDLAAPTTGLPPEHS